MRNRMFRMIAPLTIVPVVLALLGAGAAGAAPSPVLGALAGRSAARAPVGSAPDSGAPQTPAVTILARPGQAYIHTSTDNNVICDSTYLDNPALNGQPATKFFVIDN